MDQALLDFAGRLRRSGITVSPAEVLDAGRALSEVGPEDRETVRAALRACLVKRYSDLPVFEALFDLFFTRGSRPEPETEDGDEGAADRWADLIDAFRPDLSAAGEMLVTGRFGALTRLMLNTGQGLGLDRMESPLQQGFFRRRLRSEMDLDRVRGELDRFLEEMQERGLDAEEAEGLRDFALRNLARMDEEVDAVIRREMEQNRYMYIRKLQEEDLLHRNLSGLTEKDVAEMRPHVARLARRLKDRMSLRLRRAERGRFDLKATFRSNIGYGGPLPELRFRRKHPGRPQVVALCDVSNSVRNFSRFMLLFLYTLGEVVSRARSFIFVGDVAEVTDLFQRRPLDEAVSMAAGGHGLTYLFRTDYGSCLEQFATLHLASINSKTTVIVLGDARNNYYDPKAEYLADIAAKAKKLIWLNPEPRLNWRLGDSAMENYAPYCTVLEECYNIAQLSNVIEECLIP